MSPALKWKGRSRGPPEVLGFVFGLTLFQCVLGEGGLLGFAADKAINRLAYRADGSYGRSLEDTYHAAATLAALGGSFKDASATCKWVSSLGDWSTSKSVYEGLVVSVVAKCKTSSAFAAKQRPQLLKQIDGAQDVWSLLYAIKALTIVKNEKLSAEVDVAGKALAGAVEKLKDWTTSGGSWKTKSGSESLPRSSGAALEILAGVLRLAKENDLQNLMKEIRAWAAPHVKGLLSQAKVSAEHTIFPADVTGSTVAVTADVLKGLLSILGAAPASVKVEDSVLIGLGRSLVEQSLPASAAETAALLEALQLLSQNSYLIPVFYRLRKSSISMTSGEKLEVLAGTALGPSPPDLTITLASISAAGKSKALVKDKVFSPVGTEASPSVYSVDALAGGALSAGEYDAKIEVSVAGAEGGPKYVAAGEPRQRVVVTVAAVVSGGKLKILEEGGSTALTTKLTAGSPVKESLTASHQQKLQITLKLEAPAGTPFHAQQVVLELTHVASKISHQFLLTPSDSRYSVTLAFFQLMAKMHYLSGAYSLQVIVGDAVMENPLSWSLGSLTLEFPEAPEGTTAPPKVVAPEERFQTLPDKDHNMRKPDSRPPKAISYLFAALVLAFFVAFLVGLSNLGVNLRALPSGGSALISVLLFHGGIAAILFLYFLYWLKLDIFTTFNLLGGLAVFTFFSGYYALSYLANMAPKVKSA